MIDYTAIRRRLDSPRRTVVTPMGWVERVWLNPGEFYDSLKWWPGPHIGLNDRQFAEALHFYGDGWASVPVASMVALDGLVLDVDVFDRTEMNLRVDAWLHPEPGSHFSPICIAIARRLIHDGERLQLTALDIGCDLGQRMEIRVDVECKGGSRVTMFGIGRDLRSDGVGPQWPQDPRRNPHTGDFWDTSYLLAGGSISSM